MARVSLTEDHLKKAPPARREFLWDKTVTGFGAIRQPSGKTSFCVRYRNEEDRDSRMVFASWPATKVKTARAEAKRLVGAVVDGDDPAQERRDVREAGTVDELFDLWTDLHVNHKRRPDHIIGRYDRDVRATLGRRQVPTVTREDVMRIRAAIVRRASHDRDNHAMANKVVELLKQLFAFGEEMGIRERDTNPAAGIKRLTENPPSETKYLVEDEIKALIAALEAKDDPDLMLVCQIQLYSGCRPGEARALTRGDIDLRRRVMSIRANKENKPREIPISAAFEAVLVPAMKDLHPTAPLVRLTKSSHEHRFKTAAKRAGLDKATPHWLRHTFASQLALKGVPIHTIQKVMGHRSIQSTMRYAHLRPDFVLDEHAKAQAAMAGVLNGG